MPLARMVFADQVQIKPACSVARVALLVFLILSHDRFAKRLLALFRVRRLSALTDYAATAGAL